MTQIDSILKAQIHQILETEDRNVYNIKCLDPTDQKQIKMLARAISFDYPKKSWQNKIIIRCVEIHKILYVQLELSPNCYLITGRYFGCGGEKTEVHVRNKEGKLVPIKEGGDLKCLKQLIMP